MDWLGAFLVLNPQGSVALAERQLMLHAVEFMLIVAVPVYILLFYFAWQYRAGNKKATYTPDWEHAKVDELIWWAIPLEIVLVLGALTWTSTHALAPTKPLSDAPPLVVEVVALDWKWLFIYPEQEIATVNYLQIPVGRPVRFDVTAAAPMNSFWIPQLGGQIYAMTGMVNPIHLIADYPGRFAGGSSNYSGPGFAQMKFVAEAVPEAEFDAWVKTVQLSEETLSVEAFQALEQPTVAQKPVYYGGVAPNLYRTIVEKYMDMSGPDPALLEHSTH